MPSNERSSTPCGWAAGGSWRVLGGRTLRAVALALPGLAALAVPVLSQAAIATTTKDVHLRAGPARDYPVVAILPVGTEVDVQGCVRDYSWCDVARDGLRGWVWAGNLVGSWNDAPVRVIEGGARIGIVVMPFVLMDYWTVHYPDRPWYG